MKQFQIFVRANLAVMAFGVLLAGTLLFTGCASTGGTDSYSTDSNSSVKGATLLMKPYNSHHHPD